MSSCLPSPPATMVQMSSGMEHLPQQCLRGPVLSLVRPPNARSLLCFCEGNRVN